MRSVKLNLTHKQVARLQEAYKLKLPITIRITYPALDGANRLFITEKMYQKVQRMREDPSHRISLPFSQTLIDQNKATINKLVGISETRPLSDFDINQALGANEWFKGVYSHDDLPKALQPNTGVVVNLDKLGNSGTHWVAVAYKKTGDKPPIKVYFDSFGLPPSDVIRKFIGRGGKFQNSQLQKASTITCGYFCVRFLREFFNSTAHDAVYQFDQAPTNKNEIEVSDAVAPLPPL